MDVNDGQGREGWEGGRNALSATRKSLELVSTSDLKGLDMTERKGGRLEL